MPHSGPLELSRDVALGSARVNTEAGYVAVRSHSKDDVPYIKWTVLKVSKEKSSKHKSGDQAVTIIVNPLEFGLTYLKPNTRVLWTPVEPVTLTKVVLTAPPAVYASLITSKELIKRNLPHFLKTETLIDSLGCYVRACEPVDEGIVPLDDKNFTISIIEVPDRATTAKNDIVDQVAAEMIDVEPFLETSEAQTLELDVLPLARPVSIASVMPPVPEYVDVESIAFVGLPYLAKLGVFSGDLVELETTDGKTRRVPLYSLPGRETSKNAGLHLSPLLVYNLGMPRKVKISGLVSKSNASSGSSANGSSSSANGHAADEPAAIASPLSAYFDAARDVTLLRVSSPASTDKANQTAFLRGLKAYFGKGKFRVVKNNDLIPVPINASLAKLLGNASSTNAAAASGNDEPEIDLYSLHDSATSFDTMIWFEVNGLPDDNEYLISSSYTRMVQTGLVQRAAPPSTLNWQSYWGLPLHFPYLADPKLFGYAQNLYKLLKASLTPHGSTLRSSILLKSSKTGAGKSTLLTSLAAQLGFHEMALDALDLVGDTDGKTLGLLKARLERAATSVPCIVSIKHFDTLARKNDVDGKDTPLVNGLVDVLDEVLNRSSTTASSGGSFIFAATIKDPDSMADSIRNKFKFEIDVTVPTERERRKILEFLTSSEGGFDQLGQLLPKLDAETFTHFELRKDVSVDALALQSAGLTPPDLCAIITSAKRLACARSTNSTVLSSGGAIKLSPPDLEKAIMEARDKFSDSIGAPKIPNVGWKDVGGLDMVKGEILDTIDMPLKHPELFSSGLKKRSGILFYGPPGTGKTLLAKAIATNFSLNFFSVKGPELLNMYIGESEANVRRVFQKARDAKPCVIFFDELDSVAPKRGNKGDSGGVMDRIVSQLLAELDGMSEGSDGVFVVGATNRPDLLDEALLRPGRFDKMLYLGVSDTHDKQQKVLEALTRKFELDPKVDLHAVAEKCPFTYTGADFYAMSSDAMLNAMTRTAGEVDAKIAKYNDEHPNEPVTIRKWFQCVATPEDTKVLVTDVDFDKAQKELVPSVSADELEHYMRVRKTFEGSS